MEPGPAPHREALAAAHGCQQQPGTTLRLQGTPARLVRNPGVRPTVGGSPSPARGADLWFGTEESLPAKRAVCCQPDKLLPTACYKSRRLGESKAGARTVPELAQPGHACADPHAMTLSSPKLFPCIQGNVIASFLNYSNIWYHNCAQPTQNPVFVVYSAFELLHKVHKSVKGVLCGPLKSQTYDSSANNRSISEINKKM